MNFKLQSKFKPAGDQPGAIDKLYEGLKRGNKYQTLLGVTGSGKTFTVANVIEKIQKPALVIAHNKTLAAQLVSEFRDFFPESAVEYFISYYDYYQPEVAEEYLKIESFEDIPKVIGTKEKEMKELSSKLKFEEAAMIRDEIKELKKLVRK